MKYTTIKNMEKALAFVAKLEIIMVDEQNSWIRLVNKINMENSMTKYIVDNGATDCLTIFVNGEKAFIRGFDHENNLNEFSKKSWTGEYTDLVYENAPKDFYDLLSAKEIEMTTFALWTDDGGENWTTNRVDPKNDGGLEFMLGYIFQTQGEYIEWGNDEYQTNLPKNIVDMVHSGKEITADMVKKLNRNRSDKDVIDEINRTQFKY